MRGKSGTLISSLKILDYDHKSGYICIQLSDNNFYRYIISSRHYTVASILLDNLLQFLTFMCCVDSIISQYNNRDMATIDIQKEVQSILKEGFLDKESRFLKTWRSRWFVLSPQALMTFKQRKVYSSPTEVVPLKTITSIKSADEQTGKQFAFRVDTEEQSYFIVASSNAEKEQWIGQIGKAMVKLNTKMDD